MKSVIERLWRQQARRAAAGSLVALIVSGAALGFQTAPTPVRPTDKPFLWRIEGTPPSYLYGTIHVPDRRVVELPEVVLKAIDASNALYTEVPLDAATQTAMTAKLMLPEGQDLRKI